MVVVPVATPVTTPVVFTEATAALAVDQVPPVTALVSVIDAPVHTLPAPLIEPAFGDGLTVMACEVAAVPQVEVTV